MSTTRMHKFGPGLFVLLFAIGLGMSAPALSAPQSVVDESQALPYLEQMIAWQRETVALEPTLGSARETLLKASLVKAASDALKYSFAFARTQAQLIDKNNMANSADADADSDRAHLKAASVKVAKHVTDLQTQIAALDDKIETTPKKKQAPLQQQLDDLDGQLKLASAQQDLIGNLLAVFNSIASSVNTGLTGKISSLSDSVTQSEKTIDAATAKADASAGKDDAIPSGGLLQVSENLFKLWRQINELHGLENGAVELHKTNRGFDDRLRGDIKAAIAAGAALGTPPVPATSAPAAPAPSAPAANLDTLLGDFKQLSSAVVPVAQTDIALDTGIHTLQEWQQTVRDEIEALLRRLCVRLGVLAGLILIPVVISDLVRRATERYIKDDKRSKQLRAVRRSLLSLAIFIIVVLNLVTEVGSFATFAGFIVGGLAVAFQNVLLSLVAFFFFYGRYSVRAGDRVSVSGVIGDVVHVGGLRFYIRELEEKDGKLAATGRVAAFPNSILFQTAAFFKYM